jgi:hypothetical protein
MADEKLKKNSIIVDDIKACADRFLRTRDQHALRRAFDKHKSFDAQGCRASVDAEGCKHEHKKELIAKESLRPLMNELVLPYSDTDSDDVLFSHMDANRDGEVDFEDVKLVHTRPSKVDQWMSSIPLGQLVASAMLRLIASEAKLSIFFVKPQEDPLRSISMLCDHDLSLVFEGIKDAFVSLMKTSIEDLKLSFEKMDQVKAKDSRVDVIRTLSCGDVSDFYNGIGDRVGKPECMLCRVCILTRACIRLPKSQIL